jgi:hypothetical protein
MKIEAHLSDAALPALVEPIKGLLRSLAGVEPEAEQIAADPQRSKGDHVATAALILAIPGAVVATIDLVERARLAVKIRSLLDKVRATQGSVSLRFGEHPYLDLREASEDQVPDFFFRNQG